jgi:hypothetical protein
MEYLLQQVDPLVVIPYWDWTRDAANPASSSLLTDANFGRNGRSSDGCVVTTGPLSGWQVAYPSVRCLVRQYDNGATIAPFVSNSIINAIKTSSTTYDAYRLAIEAQPHARVHLGIGGDMSTMYSPNDPLFYMHHAFVDKLWMDWQRQASTNLWDYNGDLTEPLVGYPGWQVWHVMAQRDNLCIDYYGPGRTVLSRRGLERRQSKEIKRELINPIVGPVPAQAINANKQAKSKAGKTLVLSDVDAAAESAQLSDVLALPPPLPDTWIRSNNLDTKRVRDLEQSIGEMVFNINEHFVKAHVARFKGMAVSELAKFVGQDKASKLVL